VQAKKKSGVSSPSKKQAWMGKLEQQGSVQVAGQASDSESPLEFSSGDDLPAGKGKVASLSRKLRKKAKLA